VSFFELPPEEDEPDEKCGPTDLRRPHWMGPPHGAVGAPVPAVILLAKTGEVGLGVTGVLAFPTGFAFTLVTFLRSGTADLDPWVHGGRRGRSLPDDLMRFGVEFGDGQKVTNLSRAAFVPPDDGPALEELGGSGGEHEWQQEYWVSPLPPPGPLTFVCEWPARALGLTRVAIDADLVLEASGAAVAIWPEDEPFAEVDEGDWDD